MPATGRPLTSVETPDTTTVVLKSDKPWPAVFDFFQLLNIVDKETMEGPNAGRSAAGTGPFMLSEWVQGDHLTLKRNPNYWQSGKPYLDELQVSVSADAQANLLRFEGGAVDVVDSPPLIDTLRLLKDTNYDVLVSKNPSVFLSFFFNTTQPPFDRKEVRQALGYAIDRKRIVQNVMQGLTAPEALPWAPARRRMTRQRMKHLRSILHVRSRCSPQRAPATSNSRSCTPRRGRSTSRWRTSFKVT